MEGLEFDLADSFVFYCGRALVFFSLHRVDHERASYAGFFLRVAWLSGELYRIFFTLFFTCRVTGLSGRTRNKRAGQSLPRELAPRVPRTKPSKFCRL
jgi:hypothetical protein